MALTQISTGGVKDDAVTAGKIPANAVGSSEIAKPIDLADNEKVRLGTGNDLEIYHDGSHSYIDDTGTGNLKIKSNKTVIQSAAGEDCIVANENGNVELYHDNSKKLETISTGVQINGNCNVPTGDLQLNDSRYAKLGDGGDFQLYFNGTDSYISHTPTSGKLAIRTDEIRISSYDGDEAMIKSFKDGATYLYYDGSNKIQTTAAGVTVTGTVTDSKGDLRSIPLGNITSAHTLVAADAGKSFTSTAGVTFPNSVFTAGQAITIINNSASDITLTQGSGATLYNTADGATGNRTLAARGMATALYISASVAYISGAGLS